MRGQDQLQSTLRAFSVYLRHITGAYFTTCSRLKLQKHLTWRFSIPRREQTPVKFLVVIIFLKLYALLLFLITMIYCKGHHGVGKFKIPSSFSSLSAKSTEVKSCIAVNVQIKRVGFFSYFFVSRACA